MMHPRETAALFQDQQRNMVEDLRSWVEMESPTSDKESVDRFEDLGMTVEWKEDSARGNHLVTRWGSKNGQLLLIGHLDTVWELGTLERMPCIIDEDVGVGPGIFDMKSGLVIILYALRLIRELKQDHYPITLLATSDEEVGSETSRQLIETEARSARAAFVLEPSGPKNGIKTKRRGVGHFTITAHGKAAHAGVEPEKGINAIEEISNQILEVQNWNNQRSGISANVGLIRGGTRTNVIPENAEATIDVRCDSMDDMKWIQDQFQTLTAKKEGASLIISGDVNRPPLERNSKVLALFEQAKQIGEYMDYPLSEYWTGGASDGNFTAALGVPTLDGLGAEGGGAHALDEHILTPSLSKRAALLYHLILRQFE
jgi:glutamate carboxypeptidase